LELLGVATTKVRIASDPVEATLVVGEERLFELSGDDVYDLLVVLNAVDSSLDEANFTMTKSLEEVTPRSITEELQKEEEAQESVSGDRGEEATSSQEKEEGRSLWLWIVVALFVIVGSFFAALHHDKIKQFFCSSKNL